jgi:hypothetical protein
MLTKLTNNKTSKKEIRDRIATSLVCFNECMDSCEGLRDLFYQVRMTIEF